MKDIEDKLKDKYDKVEVPDYMFDTSRVFKRVEEEKKDSKKKIVSIAASIIIVLLTAIALIISMPKILKEDADIIKEGLKKDEKKEIIVTSKRLNLEDVMVDDIMIINVKNIEDYTIINNIPYTKVKVKVLKSYIKDLTGEIEMYVPGGIFSIKDIKENVKYDNIDDISKFKDDDIVKVTYYNEIYIPVAEEGKTYISTINSYDNKSFVIINKAYGFKEYDPETNIVKDDMGDEQLDINKYLESINP